jgi:SAM-dependent methyltransferase
MIWIMQQTAYIIFSVKMDDLKYEIIEGIKCYNPELAMQNKGFQREGFEFLFKVEEKNFWFKSRNNGISYLFEKYLGTDKKRDILEIGCGTGFVLSGLSKYKNYNLTGAEIYLEGLKYAKQRLKNVEFIQCDATNLPFENEFHAVGAFDVLEHIDEDELVIKNVNKALKKDGKFFISVPQYKFMWSSIDDITYHKRRYSRKELVDKISRAGFKIEYVGSFVTSLFPIMYVSRLLQRSKKKDAKPNEHAELDLNPIINKVFENIMKIDESFIRYGISLPYGGSLILVAKKL